MIIPTHASRGLASSLLLAAIGCVATLAASIADEPTKTGGGVAGLPRTQRLIAEKKPIRVVAYGDSISEVGRSPRWHGGAGSSEANWGGQLVRLLAGAHPGARFKAVHFAIGGQNTYEGLGRLDGLEPLAPHLVLVAFGANDCCHHYL